MQRERMIFRNERPVHTPWGVADYAREYAEGIVFYSTPSHGGFKLSAERLAQMHTALREKDGWFEEDCAWAKVAFAFPEWFTDAQHEAAIRTLKDWCPDEYEAVTGEALAPGESHIKDQRLFHECHAQDWVVISAIRSDQHPGMVECIATIGGRCGQWGKPDSAERRYLVSNQEYDQRGKFGFVIDPDRHALCDGPSNFLSGRAAS
ncbi:hypothetical protein [Breoghania sp. JC706]|uniref:DUF7007 domain-containing protein n=1 Tax=Breoghania sp. JC706 TaxID=3117732 RepID=UPI003008532D